MTHRFFWALSACLVAGGAMMTAACSAEGGPGADDDATTSAGGAAQGGSGAGGAMGGAGGAVNLPCGTDCSAIATPDCYVSVCNEGQHAGPVGSCVVVADDDGVACDDGAFCTTGDTCQAGVCTGGPPNDCGLAPPACEQVVCDEGTDACATEPVANGESCFDPTDLCLAGTTCQNGLCVGGTAKDCFFSPVPNECHVAVCNPSNGMCEPVPGNEGQGCTDGADLCTVGKTCTAGACQGGAPKDCSGMTQGCNLGVCDLTTGQCFAQPVMNNDPCDDLNPCTSGEICSNGACGGGAPVTACTMGDSCCPMGCTVQNDADCAITDLALPPYQSTFSSTLTRGYWFTAPVSFTIKELRVPSDVGNDVQNLQVVKFTNGPPTSNTTAHVTLHYSTNVTGSNWAIVNIPVVAGDVIGILGARGTTQMHNSYAMGNFSSAIFGSPVTLHRLYYQSVLHTAPAGGLYDGGSGQIGRVELRYGP